MSHCTELREIPRTHWIIETETDSLEETAYVAQHTGLFGEEHGGTWHIFFCAPSSLLIST